MADERTRVLGVVASTGGPTVLEKVLKDLPGDLGGPVLVVLHIQASLLSSAAEWLGEQAGLPVEPARSGHRAQPGRIYLAPIDWGLSLAASYMMRFEHGVPPLRLGDHMLASLARTFGSRAAGLVLTGMGSDGAAGLAAIRGAGGKTAVQARSSALLDSMPARALPHAEVELPIDAIGPWVVELLGGPGPEEEKVDSSPPGLQDELLRRGAEAFQRLTGNRVGHAGLRTFREALAEVPLEIGLTGAEEAIELLEAGRVEVAVALARRLSVPESYFFREPAGWRALERLVFPAESAPERPLRVWSVGCARGEEPETLWMLAHRPEGTHVPLQVLATDMDPVLLEDARRGVHGRGALRALPDELRSEFEEVPEGFRLRRGQNCCQVDYRVHLLMLDFLPDPWHRPGGLDLVLCRNLLIYFHRQAVARAFTLFHELLRPGGHLLLAATDPWPRQGAWKRMDPQVPLFRREGDQ